MLTRGPVSETFQAHGIVTFDQAIEWVHALPYGRNSDRADFMKIFSECRGTCSTKHAALAALGLENGLPIKLQMAVCKLDAKHHPTISPLLDRLGVSFFPEAHCYLDYRGQLLDVTFPNRLPSLEVEVLEEHTITAKEIGDHKLSFHQHYLRNWLNINGLDQRFAFEEVWQLREEWIMSHFFSCLHHCSLQRLF